MTPQETGKLLGICAAYDNRAADEAAVYAWYRVLGKLPYAACESAVVAHYAESREWIMPADVRRRARRELDHAADQQRLRDILDPGAYRRSVDAADAAFMRKLQARTSRTLRAVDE